MKNKIIKINSHPRSGTNFLGALLKENFYTYDDMSVSGQWGHWNNRQTFKSPVLHGKLFGDHSFKNNRNPKIYIYRDGRSVALSVWKSQHFLNKNIKGISFSDFLKYKLDWEGSPNTRVKPKYNIITHWLKHVETWHNFLDKSFMIIRYEDLLINTEKVLYDISKFYGLDFIDGVKKITTMVGPSPNKGNHDEWKKYFTKNDEEYFYSIVNKENKFLYDGL